MVEINLLIGAAGNTHPPAATGILVNQDNPVLAAFIHRSRGAGGYAGGVQTVVANPWQIEHKRIFNIRLYLLVHLFEDRVILHGLGRSGQVVIPVRPPLNVL